MDDLIHDMALAVLDELARFAERTSTAAPPGANPLWWWNASWISLGTLMAHATNRDADLCERWNEAERAWRAWTPSSADGVSTWPRGSACTDPYPALREHLRRLGDLGYVVVLAHTDTPHGRTELRLPQWLPS